METRPTQEALPTLIVLSGLPGVGKTTVARAMMASAVMTYVRIDSIEDGLAASTLAISRSEDAGHRAGWAVVGDNLLPGRVVLVEAVNEDPWCREGWAKVADAASARLIPVELVCSDPVEHRHRVTARGSDWEKVVTRPWEPWATPRQLIDTATTSPEDAAAQILATLG